MEKTIRWTGQDATAFYDALIYADGLRDARDAALIVHCVEAFIYYMGRWDLGELAAYSRPILQA